MSFLNRLITAVADGGTYPVCKADLDDLIGMQSIFATMSDYACYKPCINKSAMIDLQTLYQGGIVMFRVYCFIDTNRKYRYYRTKSGMWSEWVLLAQVFPFAKAQELARSEKAFYEHV